MENKVAKETRKRALDKGTVTGDEDWVASKDLVSTELLPRVKTKVSGKEVKIFIKPKEKGEEMNVLYTETGEKKKACVGRDKDGNLLWIGKKVRGKGLNGYYLYRRKPVFKGQEPVKDVYDEEGDDAGLFLCGRVLGVKETSEFCAFSIFSAVIGPNPEAPDTGLGCLWKDVYKAIKIPQFQYSARIFDMDGNLVVKSEQEGNLSTLPAYEIAPGVDIPHAIMTCMPLLPDGSQVGEAIEIAELGTLFLGF